MTVPCSITTGYVPLARGNDDAAELLDTAHEAVRQAKALGHGLMCQYNRALSRLGHRALGHDLRLAAQRDEFFLVYQVKTCLGTMQPTGVEALLRWDHDDRTISPVEFVPVAEETGLIVPIGEWVLREACMTLQRWRRNGLIEVGMSVNVSVLQFLRGLKSGAPEVTAPVYSHVVYDIVPGDTVTVRQPDILILEGLNVLQPARSRGEHGYSEAGLSEAPLELTGHGECLVAPGLLPPDPSALSAPVHLDEQRLHLPRRTYLGVGIGDERNAVYRWPGKCPKG